MKTMPLLTHRMFKSHLSYKDGSCPGKNSGYILKKNMVFKGIPIYWLFASKSIAIYDATGLWVCACF